MRFNKLMNIILIVAIIMAFMNAVAAADSLNDTVVGTDEGNIVVENDLSNTLQSSADSDVLGANTWYVKAGATDGDGSQESPYGDLKSALDNVNLQEGDTIYVMSGNYNGTSNTGLTIDKNKLNIISEDSEQPIFDGEKSRQIFKITGNDIVLKGLKLTNGKSANGGALYIDANNVVVDSCTIISSNANSGRGGGIYIAKCEGVSIISSTISSNIAKYVGAGIYNLASNTLIANCYLYNDIANTAGGIYSNNKISVVNSKISSSKTKIVDTYGGGINLDGIGASGSLIDNVTFSSCYSDLGGAIAITGSNDIIINNCDIENSIGVTSTGSAYNSDGAAIWMNGERILINNTKLHDNLAYGYGVIYVDEASVDSIFNNCTFLRNVASGYHGGAIYSLSNNLRINGSYFEKNHCTSNGGAIVIRKGTDAIIENSEFVGNYGARGGAIYYYKAASNPTVSNCIFTENGVFPKVLGDNVTKGGAIFSGAQNTTIVDSTFERNVGLSSGAIQLMGDNNKIEDCTFKNNYANHYGGGAISSGSSADIVSNCVFENNKAVGYGGAISMNYVTVIDSVFTENSADHGGAIYTINATVKNCEFNENKANNNWVVLAEDTLELSGNKNLEELVVIEHGFLMATSATPQIPVQFGNDEIIKITTSEHGDIAYADGYIAYCVENFTDAPTFGVLRSDVAAVKNAMTQEQVGEYLKLLVYYYSDKLEYKDFAEVVHIFTDYDYTTSDNEAVKDVLSRFKNGESIPDLYIEKQDDGSFVQYEFKSVIVPQATQNLLLYNISTVVPNMTVQKISNNATVKVGDLVSFDIIVNNTGTCVLTGVYVIDSNYTDGLEYNHFVDETGKWSYEGDGKFTYSDALKVNQTLKLTVFFKALSEGLKVNKVVAGNNITNDTVNSTNSTNVTVEHDNETVPENETPEKPVDDTPKKPVDDTPEKPVKETPKDSTQPQKEVKAAVENATGNPLMALLAVLLLAGVTSLRKFKK